MRLLCQFNACDRKVHIMPVTGRFTFVRIHLTQELGHKLCISMISEDIILLRKGVNNFELISKQSYFKPQGGTMPR